RVKMKITYRDGAAPMTKASSGPSASQAQTTELHSSSVTCRTDEQAECPQCASTMRLWAGFYRCPNCGFKESCCF
ncbi:MAG TPA: hypothetical protein VFX76_17445, partial [Roseiflexaceae bacterium]|nr:hypothetical protein [Roseiflexaceae bacterium]